MGIFYHCPECNSKKFETIKFEKGLLLKENAIYDAVIEHIKCNACDYQWEEVYIHACTQDKNGQIT